MSYLIFHVESTFILRGKDGRETYRTEAAAKAALTRAIRLQKEHRDQRITQATHAVSEVGEFHRNIEKQVTRRNLMSGKEFSKPINTPACCDPSSETYWSM